MGPAEPDSIILLMRSGQRFSPPPIRPQPACTATPRRVGALLAAMIGFGALPTLAQEATPVAATTLPLDLNLAATDAAPAPSSAASPPTLASEARTPGVGFEPPEPRLSYLLGAGLRSSPNYSGAAGSRHRLSPVWLVSYGRFKLSTGGANALLGYGAEMGGSGATATLLSLRALQLNASLGFDNGRSASDDPRLSGLPDVRRTITGRLGLGLALGYGWAVGTGLTQDLLGRDAGSQVDASLSYTWQVSPRTRLVLGGGTSWGNGTYMNSHYGVPAGASSLPAYQAGAGFYSRSIGVSFTSALTQQWLVYGGLGGTHIEHGARHPARLLPGLIVKQAGLAQGLLRVAHEARQVQLHPIAVQPQAGAGPGKTLAQQIAPQALALHAGGEIARRILPTAVVAQTGQHAGGAVRVVLLQPLGEHLAQLPGQAQHGVEGRTGTGLSGRRQHLLHVFVEEGDLRRHAHPHRHPRLGQCADRAQAPLRRRGPGLQAARQLGVQGGDGHIHRHQALARHGAQQIQVALDQAGLGDQRERVLVSLQDLDHAPRQAQLALYRLVAVGGRAQVGHAGLVGGPRQGLRQQLGQVVLGHDPGLEVQARRITQVAVGGPRIAVAAAMLAAPVGVDRLVKSDVGRIVAAQGTARGLGDHLGGRSGRIGVKPLGAHPAIVRPLALVLAESMRHRTGHAPPLQHLHRPGHDGRRAEIVHEGSNDCIFIQFIGKTDAALTSWANAHQRSMYGRRSSSKVQASRGCWCSSQ